MTIFKTIIFFGQPLIYKEMYILIQKLEQ